MMHFYSWKSQRDMEQAKNYIDFLCSQNTVLMFGQVRHQVYPQKTEDN